MTTTTNTIENTTDHGTLCDYATGDKIRPATREEQEESQEQAQHDGGRGVISVGGRSCYVEG